MQITSDFCAELQGSYIIESVILLLKTAEYFRNS